MSDWTSAREVHAECVAAEWDERHDWNVMQMRGDHFAFYMSSPAGYKLLELAQSFRVVAENHPVDCVQDCAFEERPDHFGACVDDSEYDSAMSE